MTVSRKVDKRQTSRIPGESGYWIDRVIGLRLRKRKQNADLLDVLKIVNN
jgi:hypothetical protein